jgi:hypothetical protein
MKGQAALEFLMTYGWAILIVIAVVAALYAMGVFKLPTGGLGKCSPCFPPGSAFAYVDHNPDTLVLQVGPHNVNITEIASSTCTLTTIGKVGSPNERITITPSISGCFKEPSPGVGNNVQITYQDLDSTLTHVVNITLHGA